MPPAWAARVLPPPSYSPGIAARLRTARGLPPAFVQPGMPQIHRLRLLLGSHAFFVPIRANSPTSWAQTVALGGDWQCKPPDASLARLDLRHTRAVWGGLVLGIPSRRKPRRVGSHQSDQSSTEYKREKQQVASPVCDFGSGVHMIFVSAVHNDFVAAGEFNRLVLAAHVHEYNLAGLGRLY